MCNLSYTACVSDHAAFNAIIFYVYLVGDKRGKEPPIDLKKKKKNEGASNFYIWQMLLSNATHSEWIQAN